LLLQATNSGVLSLTTDQLNATKRWVVGAVEHDKYYITNVDIASQVLIALSGKSILHIGRWSSGENIWRLAACYVKSRTACYLASNTKLPVIY
jgi:hypothetical protein